MSVEPAFVERRYAGASVLVTGGSGFIGSHLVHRLASYGARVTTLSRRAAITGEPSDRVAGDVSDDALVSILINRAPDYVFHLAAYSGQVPSFTDHQQSLTTNCLGTLNLLDAIRRLSPWTRLCFPSSRLVYGRTRYLPVDEEHPRDALSLYGIHKRTAEEYCAYYAARWGVEAVILRIANPYGPHDPADHNRYNIANWMIDALLDGREVTIFGRGEQLRDYIYIDDAIDAMLAAAIDPQAIGRIYNVGSSVGTPLVDFVLEAERLASAGSHRFVEWPAESLQVETGDFVADVSRIANDIGWAPRTSLTTGLEKTIRAQYRAQGDGQTLRAAA
jgi:UDP-glucose 4-epimerase